MTADRLPGREQRGGGRCEGGIRWSTLALGSILETPCVEGGSASSPWGPCGVLRGPGRDVAVVLVLLASHALSEDDRQVLREAGLRVVLDDEGELAQALAVRATPTYVILAERG